MKNKLRILIVYKQSFLSATDCLTSKLFNAPKYQMHHFKHYEALRMIESSLRTLQLPYQKRIRNPKIDYSNYNLIITVGGDGTLLAVARSIGRYQLLLGVNSDPKWSMGQFCHAHTGNFLDMMLKILNNSATIKPVYKLRIIIQDGHDKKCFECLNDILISHVNPASMSRYEIKIGKDTEEHRNSGIWLSSAAGSTGAILSAGGCKIPEQSRIIQYKPRELYHIKGIEYRLKGGLINPTKKIIIISRMQQGRIFVDGAHIWYPFQYGDRAVISNSPNFIRLVHGFK